MGLVLVVLLAVAVAACNQTSGASLTQRTAARVASEQILAGVFQGTRDERHVWSWPELPTETRLALALARANDVGWSDDIAKIVAFRLEVIEELSKDAADLDRAIEVSAKYGDRRI